MTARITLIAHASTPALRKAVFPADEELDVHGRDALAKVAPRFPSGPCLSAHERRCVQTASSLGLRVDIDPALRDLDHGAWTGLALEDVVRQHPDQVASWLSDPEACPHGGEPVSALLARMAAWLDGKAEAGERITVITHPSVIRAILLHALLAPAASYWRLDIAPLTLSRLSHHNGVWRVASVGAPLSG